MHPRFLLYPVPLLLLFVLFLPASVFAERGKLVTRVRKLEKKVRNLEAQLLTQEASIAELGKSRYGDGSSGDLIVSEDTTLSASLALAQYADCIVESGVTLTVLSGTTLRCNGKAQIFGRVEVVNTTTETIVPSTSAGDRGETTGGSGFKNKGGDGGEALEERRLRLLFAPAPNVNGGAGGEGFATPYLTTGDGGVGGGSFLLAAKESLEIGSQGSIYSKGGNGTIGCGGGAGGIILLFSSDSILVSGEIVASGGNAGDADASTRVFAGGGGGGGGIVHLIAPEIDVAGTIDVLGGQPGTSLSEHPYDENPQADYYSGGGGGACGGSGGVGGGLVNLASAPTRGQPGEDGKIFQTLSSPEPYL